MRTNKDGSRDKRFKEVPEESKSYSVSDLPTDGTTAIVSPKMDKIRDDIYDAMGKQDPNELHTQLLKDNNLELDFDVVSGTVETKFGIIQLEKPTLIVKAKYVTGN